LKAKADEEARIAREAEEAAELERQRVEAAAAEELRIAREAEEAAERERQRVENEARLAREAEEKRRLEEELRIAREAEEAAAAERKRAEAAAAEELRIAREAEEAAAAEAKRAEEAAAAAKKEAEELERSKAAEVAKAAAAAKAAEEEERRKLEECRVVKYDFYGGLDHGGDDIACFDKGESADVCREKCDKDPNCKAYNYIHPNGPWGKKSGCCYKRAWYPMNNANKVDFWYKKKPSDECTALLKKEAEELERKKLLIPCERPSYWCTHAGSTYKAGDCIGNGIEGDHFCWDKDGNRGTLMRTNNCESIWPSAPGNSCPRLGLPPTKACVRPSGWCSHAGDFYKLGDCIGDGIEGDHFCWTKSGNRGTLMRTNNCQSVWPKAPADACPKLDLPWPFV